MGVASSQSCSAEESYLSWKWAYLISAMHSQPVSGGQPMGKHGFGTNSTMDFRAKQAFIIYQKRNDKL